MGATRNVVLSLAAVGLLVVGLLVLIPEPARGAQPGAPTVALSDIGTASDGNIRTTVTTVVTIPQGKLIPLEYAEIIIADGTQNPAFAGALERMSANVLYTCVAGITSWGGATQTHGTFSSPGYNIVNDGYGYGYAFDGTTFSSDVLSGYGTGYGYGSTTGDLRVTVTVQADNCPPASAFTTTFRTFHVQVAVGGDSTHVFSSIPTTLSLRNPEATFPAATVGNTDTTPSLNEQIQDAGAQTNFNLQFQAGASVDGTDYTTGTVTYTPPNGDQTTLTQAVFTTNQAVPDGATVSMSFMDLLGQSGASFPAGSTSFGIPAGDLGTRTGGAPFAGFFSITMNGLPAGATGGAYIDIAVTLDVPQSYFTANGLTVANFHLERYSDAGAYQGSVPCSGGTASTTEGPGGTTVPAYRFTCTISDFSSFAMVASALAAGGGGGVTQPTSSVTPTATTSVSTSVSGSVSASASGSQTVTSTSSGTDTEDGGDRRGGSAPGLGFVLLVAALVGIALIVRRQLK